MNLTPLDWSRAQNLLLQLAKALSPLVVSQSEDSSFFPKKFFKGKNDNAPQKPLSQRNVTLLDSLRTLQEEIEKWEEVGEREGGKTQKIQVQGEKKVEPKESKKSAVSPPPPKKNLEPFLQREPLSPVARFLKQPEEVQTKSIPKQARELVYQVQIAIAELTSSNQFKNPKHELVLQALKQIKPRLNRIIETVLEESKEKLLPKSKQGPRRMIPPSPRKDLLESFQKTPREENLEAPVLKKERKFSQNIARVKEGEGAQKENIFSKPPKEEALKQIRKEFLPIALPISTEPSMPKKMLLKKKKKKKEEKESSKEDLSP